MIPLLPPFPPQFPATKHALSSPNGLLAAGGALTVEWLIHAYHCGIYPWYNDPGEIYWWSPAPRMVLIPEKVHVSSSLKKVLRRNPFTLTFDQAFPRVIEHCALARPSTWILPEMQAAYCALHKAGVAHSVEVWADGSLVGGLYGVHLGRQFFGESMFSLKTNTSKVALVALAKHCEHWEIKAIDCQMHTQHLASMGAELYDRPAFEAMLSNTVQPCLADWRYRPEWMNV